MTDTEREAHRQATREMVRKRQAARADEVRAARERSRESGTWCVLSWPDPLGGAIESEISDGGTVETHAGVVELLNMPGRQYDYRVRVEIEREGVLRAVVSSVEVMRRLGGPAIAPSIEPRERRGELYSIAVAELTRGPGGSGPVRISEGSAQSLISPPLLNEDELLELVRQADREAREHGLPIRQHTVDRLRNAGEKHSESQVKKLRRRAGLSADQGPGRPRQRRSA